jgi:uncharacterized protein YdiU (UPF0061 family)
MPKFDNSYARLPASFYSKLAPSPVKAPRVVVFNDRLAAQLGFEALAPERCAQIFSGNEILPGMEPLAQLYAGHQFGNFVPQLGDGRAHLLGEIIDPCGQRRDIQLKGSGKTPYSRRGDGRAWLGPVLREYIVSEAMHALGVPTTRALAAVTTKERIYREQGALPGAILTRVASSHIRVGTFQAFAARGDLDSLATLTNYAIQRHYPDANGPLGLLRAVCAAQAELIAAWMSFGFIHGVMNTDNCSIAGETIDYGPCAFMDAFHPGRVFSSIDHGGRYAFGNQPRIIVWNMAQFATALIQQMPDPSEAGKEATEIIHAMPTQIEAAWLRRFGQKIGITAAQPEDFPLIEEFLNEMADSQVDFTNRFRALAEGRAPENADWAARWTARIAQEVEPETLMKSVNPVFIPRNHLIEEMINAALSDDYAPFEALQSALATPFTPQPKYADLAKPPTQDQIVPATFCGT